MSFLNDTGNLDEVEVFTATNDDAKINSNLILDLGVLRVSDAAGLQGSFYVYNGTNWVRSTQWRRGNTGTFAALYKLLTKEILSLHKKPIERYNGTIIGAFPFGTRYEFDNAFWIPLNGDYDANMDEWRCEWFAIEKIESNITTSDPVGEGDAPDFTARISSQQGTDEIITAVEVNTTTSEVTGNATIGGTLGVTGTATLGVTNVGAFTTTNQVAVTVNQITATPGGSETLSISNHFNFISYSGTNGTYTINLPAAQDGVILRFKTDNTIEANKTVTLDPNEGERIDGEASYVMDRGYDGITILGLNSAWFVIQKKEK